ncbi:hypothetical protein KJ840_04400 [Patescibacteria group bacterium]|nr:hypothetical protein [Patescibacteria group bacterium]
MLNNNIAQQILDKFGLGKVISVANQETGITGAVFDYPSNLWGASN